MNLLPNAIPGERLHIGGLLAPVCVPANRTGDVDGPRVISSSIL